MADSAPGNRSLKCFSIQLLASERGFKSVRKSDKEMLLIAGRRPRHDTDSAAWMHPRVVGSTHLLERDDLRSRKNIVRLMGHCSTIICNRQRRKNSRGEDLN